MTAQTAGRTGHRPKHQPDPQQPELAGRLAVVTGAGRGIGAAIAVELAQRGAGLLLLDLSFGASALKAFHQSITPGGFFRAECLDLSRGAATRRQLARITQNCPAADVLVNNAGYLRPRPFLRLREPEWDRHFDTNVSSMFTVTSVILPNMLARRQGRIINIASELALTGRAGFVAYCASKSAVIGLTKALAREVAPEGIRVNCIAPGPTVTRMLTRFPDEFNEVTQKAIPAHRFGAPADIAKTVAFLAGPGGDYFVGQVLSPNGGTVI